VHTLLSHAGLLTFARRELTAEGRLRAGSAAARGAAAPCCFSTITGSHYVDVYDGAKSKGAWTVRDTVDVQNAPDAALRSLCVFLRVATGWSIPEC
jgi:hypothetical protein